MIKNMNSNERADDDGASVSGIGSGSIEGRRIDGKVVIVDNTDSSKSEKRNIAKHSNGNEALESEELEILLKSTKQKQQLKVYGDYLREKKRNYILTRKQQGNSDTQMTTYNPHNSQKKHQKSDFQLDTLKSPGQILKTTAMYTSRGENDELDKFNDSNLRTTKTTTTLSSPSLNLTSHHHQNHETHNQPHHQDYDREEYKGPKIWMNFLRDWPIISQPLAILVIFVLLWIMGYALAPKYTTPETTIMRIAFLFVGAQISGILVTFMRLPDMLGMLFFGVLYTNLGLSDFNGYERLEAFLREIALITLMLLAGFGLDGSAFKKLWPIIMRLTLIPTIAETLVICILAHFLLEMPWFWGLLLGLVITAVSPNVVVTVMLKLKEEKLGLNNGIHTLIYAMTTCNDVVAIFTFGVILGVIFNPGKLSEQVLQGPVGIVVGVVYGYIFGLILVHLPSRKSKYVNGLRFTMTVLGGCVSVMGSRAMGYPSAGALGCVAITFVAGSLGKRQPNENNNTSVTERLDLLWKFLKPVSFSLIGKEINFSVLDGNTVRYGLILIALGSLLRLIMAYLSTVGSQLTPKERCYVTISGFPKATVQAALGPIALDLARQLNAKEEILSLASNVLVISVIAIIFTAPLGAILMIRLAPLWLKHGDDSEEIGSQNIPAQSQDNIAIITVGDNRNVMDSAHSNNGFDHGNSGR